MNPELELPGSVQKEKQQWEMTGVARREPVHGRRAIVGVMTTASSKSNNPAVFYKTQERKWGKFCNQHRAQGYACQSTYHSPYPCWAPSHFTFPAEGWLPLATFRDIPIMPPAIWTRFLTLLHHGIRQLFCFSLLRVKALLEDLWRIQLSPSTPAHWSALEDHPWTTAEKHIIPIRSILEPCFLKDEDVDSPKSTPSVPS